MAEGINKMQGSAMAVLGLSAVVLTALAVVNGFKDTGLVANATAEKFIAGLTIFGTFMAVIVLALVGKIIIGLFKKE